MLLLSCLMALSSVDLETTRSSYGILIPARNSRHSKVIQTGFMLLLSCLMALSSVDLTTTRSSYGILIPARNSRHSKVIQAGFMLLLSCLMALSSVDLTTKRSSYGILIPARNSRRSKVIQTGFMLLLSCLMALSSVDLKTKRSSCGNKPPHFYFPIILSFFKFSFYSFRRIFMESTSLRTLLPHPDTPWLLNSNLFQRLQSQKTEHTYKKCEITSGDPEWNFILQLFNVQKPDNRSIAHAYCIHNAAQISHYFYKQKPESTIKPLLRIAEPLLYMKPSFASILMSSKFYVNASASMSIYVIPKTALPFTTLFNWD